MITAQPVLQIDNLSISFRVGRDLKPAVQDVSLTVAAGETLAVVGESGSGKSTTAAAVNRLLADNAVITGGTVTVRGEDVATLSPKQLQRLRGAGIGLVPQDPMTNLDPVMRVGDQIAEALVVHDLASDSEAGRRAVELLEVVGIDDPARRARQWPHELSGGMRQRVLIAIGLACRPALLIADEPTSALDVTVQRRILDTIAELTDDLGTAVLLITHDLALAAERADRIAVMQRGRIVELGAARQVMREPGDDYTRRLIAASPALRTSAGSPFSEPATSPPISEPATPPPFPEPARRGRAAVEGLTSPISEPASLRAPVEESAPTPLVTTTDLIKVFPGRRGQQPFTAVDRVSITIPVGRTVALVGGSGSGKSTTANLILGLDQPSSGRIMIDGEPRPTSGAGLRAFRRQVQPVFQNPYASLDPRYPIGRSIAEPLAVHKIGDKAWRRSRVAELLEQVALPADVIDRRPTQLSGGQRQRVAIARALALEPRLVVLDEAVSALDVLVQQQILELLQRLQDELGLAYLFISHDLAVVDQIAHHVYVMRQGEVVDQGPPAQLFGRPGHEYTRELLDAIPRPA